MGENKIKAKTCSSHYEDWPKHFSVPLRVFVCMNMCAKLYRTRI